MSLRSHLARFAATATAALAVLCGPASALAEEVKVLVLPYAPLYDSIPRATGEQIARTLESGLIAMGGVEVVQLPSEGAAQTVAGATPEQIAAVDAARAEYERGLQLLARRRVKQALDAFDAAIAGMEANAPALLDVGPLVGAHLQKAVALFLMGREDEAVAGPIPTALRLDPDMALSAGPSFQQVFIDTVEKVRDRLKTAGYGSLRVDTTPPGAQVWVDDQEAGYSPVQIAGLIPGRHYVKIKPPGADPYIQVVEIQKDALYRITPDDGRAKEGPAASLVSLLTRNQLDDRVASQAAALAKQHGATKVAIGGAFAQGANMGIVSFLFDVATGAFGEMQRLTLDRDMLGATIEINKVAAEMHGQLGALAAPVSLPRPLAADARPGEEKIDEVDFSGLLAAGSAASSRVGEAPAATPAAGKKTPATRDRRPITRTPIGGGGSAPEASLAPAEESAPAAGAVAAAPAPVAVDETGMVVRNEPATASAPAPAPAQEFADFQDFRREPDFAPEPQPDERRYLYAAGTSIEDETAFEQKKGGGLLTKWWFWAGAGVLAAGAVGIGIAASDGADAATGTVRW